MIEPNNSNNKQKQDSNLKYIFLQLKPFKDNELWVNHRDTVLKNCASLGSKKIAFIIYWNSSNIK